MKKPIAPNQKKVIYRGLKAKKSLGQHFLHSPTIIKNIADTARIHADDVILEIGPGEGIMTEVLSMFGGKVIAVEKDDRLISSLGKKFERKIKEGKIDIVHKDILEFDPNILRFYTHPYKVIANIPYYITGEIIRKFLTADYKPESMTLLVQKEVAERIVAKDGKESILSLSVKFFGTPTYVQTVKRGSFNPPPKVDSAIIHIGKIETRDKRLETRFFETIKAGFKSKRKKLISNLSPLYQKDALTRAFEHMSLSENTRAEELSLKLWLDLLTYL